MEGDIKGCFDNIDHKVLLDLLSAKIKDSRFINLIRKFLKAGYMEDWVYHKTYSGTPQGGILSPVLTNIYLNELDKRMETIASEFDTPALHCCSTAYSKARTCIYKLRREYGKTANPTEKKELLKRIHQLEVEKRKLPCKDASDKKIVYVRYADDFLIGIKGSREDAESVKRQLKQFLSEELKMELSDEKTKITHSSEAAQFLGYDVKVRRNNRTKRTSRGIVQRTLNNTVALLIPFDKIERFMYERRIVKQGPEGTLIPIHKHLLSGLTEIEILDTYNALTRGLCSYYSMASNFQKLNYFTYLMEYSCLKTLANKHKTSISKLKRKYGIGHTWGIRYETRAGHKTMKIVRHSDLKRGIEYQSKVDTIRDYTYLGARNSLEARLRANRCELCGAEGEGYTFEIHHVNKVKNLKGKQYWERAMLSRQRKTLVVCRECHEKIHKS
ncbi:MAG: group II intron reverse transcriptase/maturase [Synergistaceae bacterium]|nr:group II intron reverse transcriptase/maturase [Synergistaceae bacterium]